jgi:hypothetical protein
VGLLTPGLGILVRKTAALPLSRGLYDNHTSAAIHRDGLAANFHVAGQGSFPIKVEQAPGPGNLET